MSALDDALTGIKELIRSGELAPGDKFPVRDELCNRLGVSPSTMREAMRMLDAWGVIESRQGSGVYVTDLSVERVIDSMAPPFGLLPLDEVVELFEIRRILETHAAAQAAQSSDYEAKTRLLALHEEMVRCEDSAQWSEIDQNFHALISKLAGNRALAALLRVVRVQGQAYHGFFADESHSGMRRSSEVGHRQIADAILAGDSLAAANSAANHAISSENWMRSYRPQTAPTDLRGSVIKGAPLPLSSPATHPEKH